jgi:two-component system, sensor histidine kinase ChiS
LLVPLTTFLAAAATPPKRAVCAAYERVRRRGTLAYHDESMSDALHHYECALQIASDHHDRAAIAKRLSNAGSALRRLGDYRKALQFLIKSLEMQRADGVRASVV